MPVKKTIAFLVAFLVLATFVWVLNRNGGSQPASVSARLLSIDLSAMTGLEYQSPGTEPVKVLRRDGVWILPDRADYPVEFSRFREFVQGLADLKPGEPVHGGERLLDELGLDVERATRIRFLGEGGTELGTLFLGGERRTGEESFAEGRYARFGNGPVVLLPENPRGLPFNRLPWVNDTLLGLGPDSLESIEIRPGEGEAHRPDPSGFWMLSYLRFQDVRKPADDFSPALKAILKPKEGGYQVVVLLSAAGEDGRTLLRYRVEGGEGVEKADSLRARQSWDYVVMETDVAKLREPPAPPSPPADAATESVPSDSESPEAPTE